MLTLFVGPKLSPNFMRILMDSASTFDVEFFGDEMILATWDSVYDPVVMQVALNALNEQLVSSTA